MDGTLRMLLGNAVNCEEVEEGLRVKYLEDAYIKLKRSQESSDQPTPFGAEAYVLCAETAYQIGQHEIAEDCLQMFFKRTGMNEFLGRAFLCQAQLHKPTSASSTEKLEKAASFLLKAISFAKSNPRHQYLVYNSSVLYWSFARPFVKPDHKSALSKTLHLIVKALDDVEDKDYEWRSQLMVSLIECYLDGGKKEDAMHVSTAAASFTKAYCPHMYKTVLSLQVQHKLVDLSKIIKDSKVPNDVAVFFKILKLRSQIESAEKLDIDVELGRIFKLIVSDASDTGRSTKMSQSSVAQISYTDRAPLVVDLARLALDYERISVVEECLNYTTGTVKDPALSLEIEFIKSELLVCKMKEKKNNYTKAVVETRLEAIRSLEENIVAAIRLKNPNLIQTGCIIMWNFCLPLLQKDLRKTVMGPITLISEALEDIDSLLIMLRCQAHMELAKCEEDQEQLDYAMSHLRKALELDDNGAFKSRIEASLHRLQLRSMLYQTPDRPEDVAALIIEQARSTSETGNSQMKRASLVKAGLALASDVFGLVMDGEAFLQTSKHTPSNPKHHAEKALRYTKSMAKSAGHLRRLGNENDRERVQIWADLAKTARKQNVWDVVRVAGKFCLLYDDGRWDHSRRGASAKREASAKGESKAAIQSSAPVTDNQNNEGRKSNDEDRDMMRLLAEIHFIHAEALIQLLQTEGVKLLESPTPVEDTSIKPKSREGKLVRVEDTSEWKTYSDWIVSLSQDVIKGFQRGATIGVYLDSPWIVCNAGVYLWNFLNHTLVADNFSKIVPIFQPIYNSMKSVGFTGEALFFCELSHALARGYMQSHVPSSFEPTPAMGTEKEKKSKYGKQSGSPTFMKSRSFVAVTDTDGLNDFKVAIEILEYALSVTNGADICNMVPIAVRHPLIKSWVLCKILSGQQLPKTLAPEEENHHSQGPMSKCLCALEALSLQVSSRCDITNCPGLSETIRLAESCQWSDRLIEIETWTRLASLGFISSNHEIVHKCCDRALDLGKGRKITRFDKLNEAMKLKYRVEQEMLYYACVLMGQSLVINMHGRNEIRSKALGCFVDACKFATAAQNYNLAMVAARHYWDTCQHSISSPIERKLLKEPLTVVLKCLAEVSKYSEFKDIIEKDEDSEEKETQSKKKSALKKSPPKSRNKKKPETGKSSRESSRVKLTGEGEYPTTDHVTDQSRMDADLTLRAALYGVLFQAYIDMGEWKEGLGAMDEAIRVMPRTPHRILLFKHRVMVNARLGKPVQFDMGKFKDSDESLLSSMWRRVARNSPDPRDQLLAYQNAIECLQAEGNEWQKVDYLAEFGEWLFVNEFPVEDCLDQFHLAINIVLKEIKSKYQYPPTSAKHKTSPQKENKQLVDKFLIDECYNIRSLETLARLHIMIADMLEGISPKSLEYALIAVSCIQKLWQNAIKNGEKAVKDGIKPGDRPFSKAESRKRDANKIDRGISKTSLPQNLEQWTTFSLPEKVKEHFNNDAFGYFISKKSVTKPELTIHYLEVLQEKLRNQGYDQLCLPVCALALLISNEILLDRFSVFLAKMHMLDLVNDLQMMNASSSLQKSLTVQLLTEEDKAISREEIQLWKEKQAQTKAEERRTKATSNMDSVFGSKNIKLIEFCKNKRLIRGVSKREVWTKMANLLIKQAQYQRARELLEEAKKSALAFDDKHVLAVISYNYALIAFHENDWGKVISYSEQIEEMEGTLGFWSKVILLKVDVYSSSLADQTTFHCHPAVQGSDKAIATMDGAISLLKKLREVSPNKASLASYMQAVLETRLAKYLMKTVKMLDEKKLLRVSKLLENSRDAFIKLCYPRYALRVIKLQLLLLRDQTTLSAKADRKMLLVKCLHVAKEGVDLAKATFSKVKQTTGKSDTTSLCMRVEWEMLDSMLNAVEVIIDIEKEVTRDVKERTELLARKDSLHKMVEDFVCATPILTDEDEQWNEVIKTAAEEGLVMLTYLHTNCERFPKLQAKASLYLRKCLHQIALQTFPDLQEYVQEFKLKEVPSGKNDTDLQTDDLIRDEEVQNDQLEEGIESDNENQAQLPEMEALNQLYKRKEKSLPIKRKYSEYLMYISQAVECLLQATQIGLRNGLNDLVAESAHCLVECVGDRDTNASCQFLALFQSAAASSALGRISQRALLDPHTSRVSGLTQQRHALTDNDVSNDLMGASDLNGEMLFTESEAFRRTRIARTHMEILKELPFHITFVVLQHSPDKKHLYGAILEKPRPGLQANKKKDVSTGASNRSFISCTQVNEQLLENLLKMSDEFKTDVCSLLTRKSYVEQQKQKRKEMLGLIERCADQTSKVNSPQQAEIEVEENRLQGRFEDLVAAIEGYLGTIARQLEESLKQDPAADTVVILADEHLLQLPLEALPVFRQSDIKSVTRDFSLQIFYHRFLQGEITDPSDSKDKFKTGKKDKLDPKTAKSDKAVTSNSTKKSKASKEYSVGRDGIQLDVSSLRYIMDPSYEWPVEDENNPGNLITDIITQFKNKTSKWSGLRGQDHELSVAELQKFIQESTSLVFYGFESLLSHLPPQFLAPLCLTDCHLMIIMDLMKTLKSSLRQAKRDALKSPADFILEQPLQMAALLSLSGAPCIVMNQWQCSVHKNKERLTSLLEGLCEASSTVGQILNNSRDSSRSITNHHTDDADTTSEKAFASNASQSKGKDGKSSKLNRRMSNAGSVRSNKLSSPSSVDQNKSEGKQRLEKILREKTERRLSIDQASGRRESTMEAPNESKAYFYECFNTVLYGLPNFTTSSQ